MPCSSEQGILLKQPAITYLDRDKKHQDRKAKHNELWGSVSKKNISMLTGFARNRIDTFGDKRLVCGTQRQSSKGVR
jgi:hypothetical protein